MVALALFAVLAMASLLALFTIIRLGVRYGVNDAMREHRAWLTERDRHRDAQHPRA